MGKPGKTKNVAMKLEIHGHIPAPFENGDCNLHALTLSVSQLELITHFFKTELLVLGSEMFGDLPCP